MNWYRNAGQLTFAPPVLIAQATDTAFADTELADVIGTQYCGPAGSNFKQGVSVLLQ